MPRNEESPASPSSPLSARARNHNRRKVIFDFVRVAAVGLSVSLLLNLMIALFELDELDQTKNLDGSDGSINAVLSNFITSKADSIGLSHDDGGCSTNKTPIISQQHNESISHLIHRAPPRRMVDTSNPIYFLHIGKAGGTSIDELFNTTQFRNLLLKIDKAYIGYKHYDWSFVQEFQKLCNYVHAPSSQNRYVAYQVASDWYDIPHPTNKHDSTTNNVTTNHAVENNAALLQLPWSQYDYGGNYDVANTADVITFLRHPVSRATSQFYFSKTLYWAKHDNASFLNQTFEEYLDDTRPNKWMQPLGDGESGTDFLAGIFSTEKDAWVDSDGGENDFKEYLRGNATAACLVAASRLERTTWFGLVEEVERSMKLLQLSFGLKETPQLPKSNSRLYEHPKLTSEMVRKIEKYVPKDLWLYEYARRLFNARWNYFMGEDKGNCRYVPPELPPLPDFE